MVTSGFSREDSNLNNPGLSNHTPMMQWFLVALLATLPLPDAQAIEYPPVIPDRVIAFPADEGSHPAFRTEWWYVTGWLITGDGKRLGFQVTFFRSRPDLSSDNPSRFAPRELLFAHAALSDPALGRLLHDQRAARAGFGLAEAREGATDVRIGDWSLVTSDGVFRASIPAREFRLELAFRASQPPLLHGARGFSQKGPKPASASHYYSLPQLRVSGEVTRDGKQLPVTGAAWLDHEWSSSLMDAEAVGWDWVGINLDDGAALMAFRMRNAKGSSHWAGGTLRAADGSVRALSPSEVEFTPLRQWRSPRSGISYPIAWRLRLGDRTLTIQPLMEDQESDSRKSTGTIYWEGAVEAFDGKGRPVGRGYLELTGYGKALRL